MCCAAEKQVEMGLTLRREGRTAAAPVQPSSVPAPSIYFGPRQQTPLGTEGPGAAGAGRRRLKTAGFVMRRCKTSLTQILGSGRVGHGGLQGCSMTVKGTVQS